MPIQVSEILAYCEICGFREPIVRHDLMLMVQVLDAEWQDHHSEKQKPRGKPH